VASAQVGDRPWFRAAKALHSGNDFAVDDIAVEPLLAVAQIATYATGVRVCGRANGELLGVHFGWQPQAQAITGGVRLLDSERTTTRVLLIAASDGKGQLHEHVRLNTGGQVSGHYTEAGSPAVLNAHIGVRRLPTLKAIRDIGQIRNEESGFIDLVQDNLSDRRCAWNVRCVIKTDLFAYITCYARSLFRAGNTTLCASRQALDPVWKQGCSMLTIL